MMLRYSLLRCPAKIVQQCKKQASPICLVISKHLLKTVAPSKSQSRQFFTSNTVVLHQKEEVAKEIQDQRSTVRVTIAPDEKKCIIKWEDGFHSKFHSIWLRHNCHCPECRHENGQRTISACDVPSSVIMKDVIAKDDIVEFHWSGENGDHHGYIPISYLRNHNYNMETIQARSRASKCEKLASEIPTIQYEEISSNEGLLKWLQQINEAGLSLVTGVPIEDGMVKKVGELMGPVITTIYEKVFSVESVEDPINLAYSNISLDFHQDLAYFESPPGIQLLHCMRFDECVQGGESVFVDLFAVVDDFRATYPNLFDTLTKVPATFQKVHYKRAHPVHLVNQKPHIRLNHLGEVIAVYWAPQFEGPLSVKEEHVEDYYRAYEMLAKMINMSSYQLEHRLQPGELVAFNNLRTLHSRKTFQMNGGKRLLQGCYVNIDMFKSKTQAYNNIYGDGRLVKRVGNQCFF